MLSYVFPQLEEDDVTLCSLAFGGGGCGKRGSVPGLEVSVL